MQYISASGLSQSRAAWSYLHLQDAAQVVVRHAEPLRLRLSSRHRVGRSSVLTGCSTCLRPAVNMMLQSCAF